MPRKTKSPVRRKKAVKKAGKKTLAKAARKKPARRKCTQPAGKSCVFLRDFYDHLNQENQLFLFSRTIEHSPVAILIMDRQGVIEFANARFSAISQMPPDALLGQSLKDLQHLGSASAPHAAAMWKKIRSGREWHGELHSRTPAGDLVWESTTIKPVLGSKGRPDRLIVFLENITYRKQSEAIIKYMSQHDSLTDLPNRELFNNRLKHALELAARTKKNVAVAILGLDRFKVINNTLGHGIGDRLIQGVGKRLWESLDGNNTIARMGGDEFLLLLPQLNSFREAVEKSQALMSVFGKPFHVGEQKLYIKASMGISLFPEDGEDSLTLLKNADAALNQAKQTGRNQHKFYTAKLNASAPEKLFMETSLRQAIERDEFILFYQPQVNFLSGQIVGMEALVRWQHPKLGLLAPDKFITLAEETGLIVPMGQSILHTACQQNLLWHKAGFPDLRIAVNLSARQFQEPELVEAVLGICKETGMPPHFLELELTESIFMEDLSISKMILQWLHKKGITIAIDDFGTGYSSLTYLKQFPIKTLKIDRSFVKDCLSNTDDAAIVTTIVSIARNLNMRITAEGIETQEQLDFLRSLGCDDFQGFLFSRPLPAYECTALLQAGRRLDTAR